MIIVTTNNRANPELIFLNQDRQLLEKLASLSNSTSDLPIRSFTETKFSGRSRLYVGNLGNDITENDLKEHFASYGEIAEVFLNKEKGFAFVRVVCDLFPVHPLSQLIEFI